MTAAQIEAIGEATTTLLELTLPGGPLEATTSPIQMELGARTVDVTLYAVAAGRGDDVQIRWEIDSDGNRASLSERHWSRDGMTAWSTLRHLSDIAAAAKLLSRSW